MPFLKYDDLPTYAFLDPASGRKARTQGIKHTRSRSALVVCKAELAMGRIFVVYAWADRVPTSTIIQKVIEVNDQFHPRVMGIESSGQQYLFANTVGLATRLQGKYIPWMPVDQPTTIMKDDRIRNTIQPLQQAGRLFIPDRDYAPWVRDLYAEWEGFPTAITKDIMDCLASIIYHLIPSPQPKSRENAEKKALAAYLRSQGLPPQYIEKRLYELN